MLEDSRNRGCAMRKVSSGEFQRETGKWQDLALREPIAITKHQRPAYVLLSFEEYKRMTGKSRRSLHVSELSDEDLAELAKSKVSEKHNHLNDELDD